MKNFKLNLAGKIIEVTAVLDTTYDFCKNYLADDNDFPDFYITITEDLISGEGRIQLSEGDYGDAESLPASYLEPLALYRQIIKKMLEYDTVMFHGSAIAVDGEAYIFTALSGTGKSTHTRLWREYFGSRAVMINDDKPLISVTEGGLVVHGTPWNGKHCLGENISAPVKAICVLERDANNHIEKISAKEAFPTVFQQTFRPRNQIEFIRTMTLIERITKGTDLYKLGCNMDIEAARVAYEGMKGDKK